MDEAEKKAEEKFKDVKVVAKKSFNPNHLAKKYNKKIMKNTK